MTAMKIYRKYHHINITEHWLLFLWGGGHFLNIECNDFFCSFRTSFYQRLINSLIVPNSVCEKSYTWRCIVYEANYGIVMSLVIFSGQLLQQNWHSDLPIFNVLNVVINFSLIMLCPRPTYDVNLIDMSQARYVKGPSSSMLWNIGVYTCWEEEHPVTLAVKNLNVVSKVPNQNCSMIWATNQWIGFPTFFRPFRPLVFRPSSIVLPLFTQLCDSLI